MGKVRKRLSLTDLETIAYSILGPPADTPNVAIEVILNDLSITGGQVSIIDNFGKINNGGLGGGILISEGFLTLNHVWVYSNTAMGVGGGIFNAADLCINNSILYRNHTLIDGGAIYHLLGKLRITNSSLVNNEVDRNGGAIYYRMGPVGPRNSYSNEAVLRNVSIVNSVAKATALRRGDPESDYFSSTGSFTFTGTTPSEVIATIAQATPTTTPTGPNEGAFGGGGIFVVGQFEQEEAIVKLPIVNTVIAKNYRDTNRTIPDDCKTTWHQA